MTGGSRYEITVVDSIEEIAEGQWNELVERSELASVFHRHGWLRAIEQGIGSEPKHLVAYKDTNIAGLFPNFVSEIDSVPFDRLTSITPGCGGPLIPSDEDRLLGLFLETIPELGGRNVISHQITAADFDYVRYERTLADSGYEPSIEACRIVVDLRDGWEGVLSRMDRDRRRKIRRGREQTVNVRDEPITDRTISQFYQGYRSVIERVGGEALPRSFLLQLAEMDDRVLVRSLTVDGEDAGKSLYLLDDERSSIHCFLSAVKREHFQYNASELLDAHTMEWGIENGYDTYDFGETIADFDDGLFRFKEAFGGRAVPILRWERGITRPEWWLFKAGREAYQRSPIVQRLVG